MRESTAHRFGKEVDVGMPGRDGTRIGTERAWLEIGVLLEKSAQVVLELVVVVNRKR
jgi:hypothetical protein